LEWKEDMSMDDFGIDIEGLKSTYPPYPSEKMRYYLDADMHLHIEIENDLEVNLELAKRPNCIDIFVSSEEEYGGGITLEYIFEVKKNGGKV
jgi:hypothetical protein